MAQASEQFPQLEMTRVFRFMVRNILKESIRGIVSTLSEFEDAASIGVALSAAVSYQVAGMNALVRWASENKETA